MKCCASSGMSSRRSRSGGTSIGKMFSRKNRSARNVPAAHVVGQVAVGGGDHAHVHAHGLRAADALELLLLQHAQQLHLRLERQVADLVEEDGAVVGQLEAALLLLHRAGERAAFVAEQLALDSVAGSAPQFTFTITLGRRRLTRWMARAISSLPVPVSPSTSTDESVSATSAMARNTCCIAAERPRISPKCRSASKASCR